LDYEEEVVIYQLRNRPIPTLATWSKEIEGLGKDPMPPSRGKGHGRKSHLSKA